MSNSLQNILHWLREGYPQGVPTKDYNPLLALLRRALNDDEIDAVVQHIAETDPDESITRESIRENILEVTNLPPTTEEVREVSARLAAAGWPLEGLGDAS